MNKKKIAVLSSIWTNEILYQYVSGLQEALKEENIDIIFLGCSATKGQEPAYRQGEINIFNLPDYGMFDAVCIFANSLDFPDVIGDICKKCDERNVPVFFCGKNDGVHYYISADNLYGMRQLALHVIEQHGAKDIMFIAGNKENADSNLRLNTLRDVMTEHGLTLPDDHIGYSNWTPFIAMTIVDKYLNDGNPLPDAIICANDSLAMCVCEELEKHNYKVPQDVIVTGFDNAEYAQYFDPSISSVDQHFDLIGKTTGRLILDLFAGKTVEQTTMIESEFYPSESCGCTSARNFDAIRRAIGKNHYLETLAQSMFETKLSTMERVITRKTSFGELSEALNQLNPHDREYEGSSYYFILDTDYEASIFEEDYALSRDGYPEEMQLIYSKDHGVIHQNELFQTKDLIPFYEPTSEGRSFLLLPLHENGYRLGYLVFGDKLELLKDPRHLRRYKENFTHILYRFHRDLRMAELNRRLRKINETDPLTQSLNRTAYLRRENELQKAIDSKNAEPFALAVFDINNLKKINDQYGHEAGDLYIRNCCRFLTLSFPGTSLYRVGGDEFVALLTGQTLASHTEHLKKMQASMISFSEKDLPPAEKVSIACGISVFDPSSDLTVKDIFNRADAEMYENKKKMKQNS